MNRVAEEIIKLRKENHLSQQDLADEVFVSRQAISKYERGECYPSIEVIKKIQELYNIDLSPSLNYDENKIIIADNQLKINNLIKINKKFKMTLVSVMSLLSILLILVLFSVISRNNTHMSKIILDDYNQIKNLLVGDVRELYVSYKGKEKKNIEKVSFSVRNNGILRLKEDNVIEAISTGEAKIYVEVKLYENKTTYSTSFNVYVSNSLYTDLAIYDYYIDKPVSIGSFSKAPGRFGNVLVGKKIDLNEKLGCESSDVIIFLGYTLEPGSTDYISEYIPSIDHEKNVIYCNFMYDYPVITYDLNGGINHPYNHEGKLHSKGKNISFYEPTKEGYFFVRWIVVYKGEVEYYYNYFTMIIEDDVTLIAEWEEM